MIYNPSGKCFIDGPPSLDNRTHTSYYTAGCPMKMKSCNSTTTAETEEADQDLLLGIEQVWTSTECGGKTLTQPQTISFLSKSKFIPFPSEPHMPQKQFFAADAYISAHRSKRTNQKPRTGSAAFDLVFTHCDQLSKNLSHIQDPCTDQAVNVL